jgi:hypothetical protein
MPDAADQAYRSGCIYDQEAALRGLRTLTPYFEFEGDVVYQYLDELDVHPEYEADKAALDESKDGGDDVAGAPHVSLRTEVMMDYIDSKPERFLRGGACATTVPTIQVVVPGHYAWALPIAAGIATNRGGVPWGFLNSVNDVTKWNGAAPAGRHHPSRSGSGSVRRLRVRGGDLRGPGRMAGGSCLPRCGTRPRTRGE